MLPVHGRGEARPEFRTPIAMLKHAVTVAGDDTAFSYRDRTYKYVHFAAAVAAMAERLTAEGVRSGDVVAVLLPNMPAYHISFYGALAAGATPALLNPAYPVPHLAPLLADAAPKVVLTTPDVAARLKAELPGLGAAILSFGGDLDFDALAATRADLFALSDGDPEAAGALFFTGGTTGVSKGVEHTNARLMAKVEAIEFAWPTRARGEVWLTVAPFFHIYGYLMGVMNPVYGAGKIVIPERFQPDLVLDLVSREKVTIFGGGPPAIYAGLMAAKAFSREAFATVEVCPAGGAPFPVELLQRWYDLTGLDIYEAYGMTEMAPITASSVAYGRKPGSVGAIIPGNRVEIVDIETGDRVLGPNEPGEIRITGPHAMTGYRNRPDETLKAVRDGFIYTGDIGTLDEDGFLTITDRKKDVIFVKGFNVFPREVEEVLFTHPAVSGVGVVGVPDLRSGERLIAFIVSRSVVTVDELDAHAKAHLPGYKQPSEYRFLDELPMTPARKLDRIALRSEARSADAAE